MKLRLAIGLVLALTGCAGSAATVARDTTPSAAEVAEHRAEEAERSNDAQRARLRELEAQLGLARAEARQLHDEVAVLRAEEASRATRIGAECPDPDVVETAEEPEPAEEAGARPVLRLYGDGPSRPSASAAGVIALRGPDAPAIVAPPPVASVRLPVSARSDDPEAGVPAIPASPVTVAEPAAPAATAQPAVMERPMGARPQPSDPAVQQYRRALAHLSARRMDQALEGIEGFLREHPRHAYADNALYWRGEIHYVQRDYQRALGAFSGLIERYPRGNKVPDALLRIGLCYERLGERSRARRVFDRLRAQYPESVAARMASREDA